MRAEFLFGTNRPVSTKRWLYEDTMLRTHSIPLYRVPRRLGANSTGLGSTPTESWAAILRWPADTERDRRGGDGLFDSVRHWPLRDESLGGADAAASTGRQHCVD